MCFLITKNLLLLDEPKEILIPTVSMDEEKTKFNPKGGRPKITKENSTIYYRTFVNFTKSEKIILKKLVEEFGGNQNNFIKNCIFNPKNLHLKNKDYKKLIYEINKVGVNINQIAFELNKSKDLRTIFDNKENLEQSRIILNEIYKQLI